MQIEVVPGEGRLEMRVSPGEEVGLSGVLVGVKKFDHRDDNGDLIYRCPLTNSVVQTLNMLKLLPKKSGNIFMRQFESPHPTLKNFPWDKFTGPYKMMDHQVKAIDHLFPYTCGAVFHAPGLGKTYTYISMAAAWFLGDAIEQCLIITPNCVIDQWSDAIMELSYAEDLEIINASAVTRSRLKKALSYPRDRDTMRWLLVSVEALSQGGAKDIILDYVKESPTAMCVDESSRIKTHNSGRTQACIQAAEHAEYRHILSGSAITQGTEELYAQFQFLDRRILSHKNYYTFRHRYCKMGGFKSKQIVGYENIDELTTNVAPLTHIVTKKQGLPDLPDKTFEKRHFTLSKQQVDLLKSIKKDRLLGEKEIANILGVFLRMQQVCGGNIPEEFDIELKSNPKLMLMKELVTEEFRYEPLVIWAKFVPEIEQISAMLDEAKIDHWMVHGAVPREERHEMRLAFQAGERRVFLANPTTMGIGVDLFRASTALFYSNTFSYDERLQAEDRLHRKGQKGHKVLYVDLFSRGSVDEYILACLNKTQDVAEGIMNQLQASGRIEI